MKINLKDMGIIFGVMGEHIKGIGRKAKCMERECSHGLMGKGIKVSMYQTRKMDMENFIVILRYTSVIGKKGSCMQKLQ